MKTGNYHFCLASHSEPMFRSEADLNKGFNCLAEACCYTESKLLAEAFMTSHIHGAVSSSEARDVIHDYRNRYSRYFNSKYGRQGRLGDKLAFVDEMVGARHNCVGIGYVLRQGMHHGLSATPFGYPHCSARAFFADDLGFKRDTPLISDAYRASHLTRNTPIPEGWRMDRNGLLLREDVLDTSYVENLFVTPRNYLFWMNRMTDEKWASEQAEENDQGIITLETIEKGVPGFNLEALLKSEKGKFDYRVMSDLELCVIIDSEYVPRYCKLDEASIYHLSEKARIDIANNLLQRFRYKPNGVFSRSHKFATEAQIRRCLLL